MRTLLFLLIIFLPIQLTAQYLIPREVDQVNGEGGFSHVEPGDFLLIEVGERGELLVKNLHGTKTEPIRIQPSSFRNSVRIKSDGNYGITFRNCSHVHLSGWQGQEDVYGIQIVDLPAEGSVGISLTDFSTNIEISHLEIGDCGFAGILAKTDPKCNDPRTWRENGFVQENTVIHHCYIHDTGGEGIYVGHNAYQGTTEDDCDLIYPHVLKGVDIHSNRIERTGWDGIQVTSVTEDCRVYDNILIDCSVEKKENQRSGIIIGGGTLADCYNNFIKDPRGTGILVFGKGGSRVFNNVIIGAGKHLAPGDPQIREHGIYLDDKTLDAKTFYGVYSNTIIQPKTDGIRISESVDFEVQVYNNIIADPGAWEVYEGDNTDRDGNDAFIFIQGESDLVRRAANATVRLLSAPLFINPQDDNYRLGSNSDYVDAGKDLGEITGVNLDKDFKKRPQNGIYDIGAYESGNTLGYEALKEDESIRWSLKNLGNGAVEIHLDGLDHQKIGIEVVDLTGRIIHRAFLDNGPETSYEMSVKCSSNAAYLFRIFGEGWSKTKKLLVY